ncbi:hypothetical protein D3C77_680800 [compost metagenome]
MYCRMTAVAKIRPPTKPPPGWLWPRSRKYTEISAAVGSIRRTSTVGTIIEPLGTSDLMSGAAGTPPSCSFC